VSVATAPNEFTGKRVLVSGGTKGLGRATVQRFLTGGAQAITAARSHGDPVDGAVFVQADLMTAKGSKALAEAALDRMGRIDILAHVVGGSSPLAAASLRSLKTTGWPS
jgi:NAD(P)-dependent dehydrogenase (short-subunit alcohol dehydrogenase family)